MRLTVEDGMADWSGWSGCGWVQKMGLSVLTVMSAWH